MFQIEDLFLLYFLLLHGRIPPFLCFSALPFPNRTHPIALPPPSSPAPLNRKSYSANSKPFLAVASAFNRSVVLANENR